MRSPSSPKPLVQVKPAMFLGSWGGTWPKVANPSQAVTALAIFLEQLGKDNFSITVALLIKYK